MKIKEVGKLGIFDRFVYWIKERESVRIHKQAGYPVPWTDDEILQNYRFCNVRRMDDKVSAWLLTNWYQPYKNHFHMLLAVALARFVNLPSSLDLLTKIVFSDYWDAKKIITTLRNHRDKGNTIFNGAYMVRGNDGIDKIECVVDFYVEPLKSRLPNRAKSFSTSSMKEAHACILQSYGLGSFMAGQIVADLRWAVNGNWRDRLLWAPMGPGSARGMNRLFGRELKYLLKQDQFLTELTEIMSKCKNRLHTTITSRLEAHDYQNCLCEFDKYERVLWGEGKPKQKYPGVG